jgi:hypothetical protein
MITLITTDKHPYIKGGAIITVKESDAAMLISRGYAENSTEQPKVTKPKQPKK